jgi:hypothetical protein
MYGFLESITILDLSGISIFGPEMTKKMNMEAQRFWFGALACGVLAGVVRLLELWAYKPVPGTAEGFGAAVGDGKGKGKNLDEKRKKKDLKEKMARDREDRTVRNRAIVRKLIADVLDLAIPGAALGVLQLDSGVVGTAMMISTFFTGFDVWIRCGKKTGR